MKDGTYGPQIVTCDIPREYSGEVPQAVSIQTTGDCDSMTEEPSNVLRVIHHQPSKAQTNNKSSIGICVQAFRFGTYDVSVRLVEWLEMVKIMGADQVYFYVYGATPNMMNVLRHYQNQVHFLNYGSSETNSILFTGFCQLAPTDPSRGASERAVHVQLLLLTARRQLLASRTA